jgi:mRNA-degrading endonuclease toxin of MazEF toxin-antitoxin module
MEKDFKKWNDKKNIINSITEIPNFHEREIWICFLGLNIGFEQDGAGDNFQRPVVIIKKFNNDTCLIIPLSTTNRRGRYYFAFIFESDVISVAVLSQAKFIDARRLSFVIGYINEIDFSNLMKKFKALLP